MTQVDLFPPPPGHNKGPILVGDLPEQTAELRTRAEVLVEQVGRAEATNKETVDKCVLLAGMVREHIKAIDKEREAVKSPYLASCREIDNHYHTIEGLLVRYDAKRRPVGGPLYDIVRLVDDYRLEQERLARERQIRLEEAARAAREAQEEAVRRQREAQIAAAEAQNLAERETQRRLAAEEQLESERLQREAQQLERHAEVVEAGPLKTAYGVSAHRRAVYRVEITDLTLALRHARKINEVALRGFVQSLYEAQVRAGVRSLPGARVEESSQTTIRTR